MTNDSNLSRRDFLGASVRNGAGLAAWSGISLLTQPQKVWGAGDRVRIAVVGVRGQGFVHVQGFSAVPNAEVAAICDVDENVIRQRLADMEKQHLPKPKVYLDYRKLLEDKSIDAVSIATPNHWHSLMGIWACQAGKDVYVEKPCSHTWWEGHQLVAAVRKYDRIVHARDARAVRGGLPRGRREVARRCDWGGISGARPLLQVAGHHRQSCRSSRSRRVSTTTCGPAPPL